MAKFSLTQTSIKSDGWWFGHWLIDKPNMSSKCPWDGLSLDDLSQNVWLADVNRYSQLLLVFSCNFVKGHIR